MTDNLSSEVQTFIINYRSRYVRLLEEVRKICEEVQGNLGNEIVGLIYGRKQKQNGEDLKSPGKITKALALKRKTEPDASPASIDDIIGLTIVVHYPDQISQVADALHSRMSWATLEKSQYVRKDGYHAYHTVFVSNREVHANLKCEVQIKTRLHDAWATKTHDLNYKPHGQTDERLSRMMQVFGDALQAIEVQSELLRNLIHERWNAEVERRRAVGKTLLDSLLVIREMQPFCDEAASLFEAIEQLPHDRSSGLALRDSWKEISPQVVQLIRTAPRDGTWLTLRLAVATGDADHIVFARDAVFDQLRRARSLIQRGEPFLQAEIWSLPLGLSACGDLEGAIEASEYALGNVTGLDDKALTLIKFNLADLLVQETCFGPPREASETARLRDRVERFLAECAAASLETEDPSVFHDARAMLTIAFSEDPKEIENAIEQLYRARDTALSGDEEIARAYFNLNIRVAWRKLLEWETKPTLTTTPTAKLNLAAT
jgi:ppGpp synthetase/RelA/SpoT-type nucleotidyltranferase